MLRQGAMPHLLVIGDASLQTSDGARVVTAFHIGFAKVAIKIGQGVLITQRFHQVDRLGVEGNGLGKIPQSA